MTPTSAHPLRMGWSADAMISDTEIAAGATSTTSSVTIPTATGSQFPWIWRSDQDGGDPSEVHIGSGGNQRNIFGAATARTVNGVGGQIIVTVVQQNADLWSAETLRVA